MWSHTSIHALFLLPITIMGIHSFATLDNVQVFRPGTHNGLTFTSDDIDKMIEAFGECEEFIRQSIDKGVYEENPDIVINKKIPGLLNLGHQRFLPDTMRDAVKDVKVSLKRAGEWVVATIDNLKPEIAEFIRDRFNWRSVELIPSLYNPLTGKTYKNVPRSIGFLPDDMPPAVSGQSPHFTVEFADDGIITVYSSHPDEHTDDNIKKNIGEKSMEKELKEDVAVETSDPTQDIGPKGTATSQAISLEEFAAVQAQISEMQRQMQKIEGEKHAIEERLNKSEAIREGQDVEMFCERLRHDFCVSPALIEIVKPHIEQSSSNQILEFGEVSMSQREAIKDLVVKIVQMKKDDAIVVPIGEYAKADPKEPKRTKLQKQEAMIAEFAEESKSEAKDPNNSKEVYSLSYKKAIAKYGKAFE